MSCPVRSVPGTGRRRGADPPRVPAARPGVGDRPQGLVRFLRRTRGGTVAGPREELGATDAPAEDEVTEAFDRIVSEGAQRLHRSWREVLTTGLAGGLEVATGVMALLAVYAETGSHLLAGLAFGVGFIALMLARSELFTEGFLVPVTAVVAGRARPPPPGPPWGGGPVAHPLRGWVVVWVVGAAPPPPRGA